LTHELKAPFSAIDANIQLIQKGYCGVLPDKALEVLERIAARSRKLSHEIQEMLQLANLRLIKKEMLCRDTYDLAEIITWCLTQLEPNAERLGIWFETDLQSVRIVTNEDHMKMLFINVLSNAVTYSHPNGCVRVECHTLPDSEATVIVEDQGIGIAAEKLDKVFDEYYRTDEAVRHNKNSTGLGLSIVKYVAQTHNLSIHVASAPEIGTRFEIRFPGSLNTLNEKDKEKNALCDDCRR
jgi:signal transduction histidine kinase